MKKAITLAALILPMSANASPDVICQPIAKLIMSIMDAKEAGATKQMSVDVANNSPEVARKMTLELVDVVYGTPETEWQDLVVGMYDQCRTW